MFIESKVGSNVQVDIPKGAGLRKKFKPLTIDDPGRFMQSDIENDQSPSMILPNTTTQNLFEE